MNLTQKITKGVMWTGFSTSSTTLLNFIILAILVRLLSPSDFGLIGMVMVVIGFAIIIADLGLGAAIIQRQDVSHEQLSTIFFLNILLGVLLCTIVYFSSGIIALFFKKHELVNLLKLISFSFIIISLNQIFRTLLQKQMNFKALAKVEVCGIIIYGISSIAFALKGFGVRSLVLAFLIRQMGETVLLWIVTAFRPRFVFKLKQIRNFMNFGIYVFSERIVNYLSSRVDYIIIGKFLGSEPLGYYFLAYQLTVFPLHKISPVIGRVAFPAFSTIQDNNKKIRFGYLKAIRYLSFATFPIMAGLLVIAPEFIRVIYGLRWAPAILILQILCLVGILKSIGTLVGTIYYSKGRSDIGLKWNLFVIFVLVPALLISIKWGINGIATSILILSIPFFIISQYLVNRLIELHFVDFFRNLKMAAVSSILLVVMVLGCKSLLSIVISSNIDLTILVLSTVIGIVVYIIVTLIQDKNIFSEIKSLILSGVRSS